MANENHLKILKQGAKVWNRWREDNPEIKPDLSATKLHRLNLEGANLVSVNLNNAKISRCNLSNAILNDLSFNYVTFHNVQLVEAHMRNAFFNFIDFNYGSLEKAILAETKMVFSRFYGVNLKDTDFNGTLMGGSLFIDVDLSFTKGLETVMHVGSSAIGIDTLYKSTGKIPKAFLHGCGVPDDFITFIPSHFGMQQAIQFYSCFISYSTKDEEFARRLYSRMRDEKLRVWFAPEHIKGGEKLFEQIERAIQIHDRLLIILSEESMQSEWVMTEIRRARKTEIEQKRRKLFPIRLVDFETIRNWERIDADSGMDIAAEVRSYYIPDFSDWKNHDSFEKGFARLLRDLRAEEERQSAQAEMRQ